MTLQQTLTGIALLALLQAALPAAAANPDCAFNPPAAMLKAKAYAGHTFRPGKMNTAVESAQLTPDVQLQIRSRQCSDVIETRFTLTLARQAARPRDPQAWLALAHTELGRLKVVAPGDNDELLAFLSQARAVPPRSGRTGACRDGSLAAPGECSWDSMGGFIFEIKESSSTVLLVATKYVSA